MAGYAGQGIVAVDAATSQTRRIRRDLTQPASLPDDNIQGMFKDRSGLIWICSDRSISRHDPSHPAVITVFGASSRPDSISDSDVTPSFPCRTARSGWAWEARVSMSSIPLPERGSRRYVPIRCGPETALPKDYINAFAASDDSEFT